MKKGRDGTGRGLAAEVGLAWHCDSRESGLLPDGGLPNKVMPLAAFPPSRSARSTAALQIRKSTMETPSPVVRRPIRPRLSL